MENTGDKNRGVRLRLHKMYIVKCAWCDEACTKSAAIPPPLSVPASSPSRFHDSHHNSHWISRHAESLPVVRCFSCFLVFLVFLVLYALQPIENKGKNGDLPTIL
jgi:hypothetical protein